MPENETVTEEIEIPQETQETTPKVKEEVVEESKEEIEVQVRNSKKTNKDYILERKEKKIQKLQAELESRKEVKEVGEEAIEIDDLDSDVISRVVEEKYGNYFKQLDNNRLNNEVNSYLDSDEGTKLKSIEGFETKFKKYVNHPSRSGVPLESIALEVAGYKNLLKIGANLSQQADEEAAETTLPGSSHRTGGATKLNSNPSLEDLNRIRNEMGGL